MIKEIKKLLFFLLVSGTVCAQESKDKVLLKIDKKPVYASEFVRLFGKNLNFKSQGEPLSIHDDIELFIDYKLKLIEAKELEMDTVPTYIEEVARYRNQLVLPYLNDDSLIDSIVEEAYERSLKEVRASHILIRVDKNETNAELAFEKITAIRNSILNGADFDQVARQKSEDPSAKKNAGDLGYFSVFRMVYPFENAAFNTPKGEVSQVFRTRFGYHILKVTDVRKSLGEMEVAHIMIKDTSAVGYSTIDKVYKELLSGGDFEQLAKKYSDDKRSSSKGGKLNRFGMGALPAPFGEVSFGLTEENIYSKPFKTAYGWHITKYINYYPVAGFEESKEGLLEKTKKDSRSKTLSNPVVLRLKKEYKILVNKEAKKDFENPSFRVVDSLDTWLLVIEKDTLTQVDFSKYIKNRRDKSALQNFEVYLDHEILEYYKIHLEESDENFKNLFQEYKNGLLLFDLMKDKIWDAAQNDTLGLQNYYDTNKLDYIKPETFKVVVLSSKNEQEIESLKDFVSDTDSIAAIEIKVQSLESVLLKSGVFEKQNSIFPKKVDLSSDTTNIYHENKYTIMVKVFERKPAVQEDFDSVKGRVISDFQNAIQEKWLSELREKHKVKINKRTVKNIASEMKIYSE